MLRCSKKIVQYNLEGKLAIGPNRFRARAVIHRQVERSVDIVHRREIDASPLSAIGAVSRLAAGKPAIDLRAVRVEHARLRLAVEIPIMTTGRAGAGLLAARGANLTIGAQSFDVCLVDELPRDDLRRGLPSRSSRRGFVELSSSAGESGDAPL